MKRILAIVFVAALACTMLSACASKSDLDRVQATQNQILQRLSTLEQSQADMAQSAQDAARRAEAAADKAEAMAHKTESIFYKNMKK